MATQEIKLDREDIILLLIEANERLLRKPSLCGITRLEKLLFLLERETDFEGVGSFFAFEPHNFGPFSKEVYEAVEFLQSCELIDVQEKTYPSLYASADEAKLLSEISENDFVDVNGAEETPVTEKQFTLTSNGRKVARLMRDSVAQRRPSDVDQLDEIIRKYGSMPLNRLIRYVYRQHPDMTIKSIHPEARNVQRAANGY